MTPMPDTTLTSAVNELKTHQTQLDMDGVMVGVSRQALDIVLEALARAGLEAGKAEESMRERAATVADQLRMVATPGENALFGQGMANAADQIATAIRALPPVTATAKWADPAYIERLERGDHLDSGFLDAIRALPLTGGDKP